MDRLPFGTVLLLLMFLTFLPCFCAALKCFYWLFDENDPMNSTEETCKTDETRCSGCDCASGSMNHKQWACTMHAVKEKLQSALEQEGNTQRPNPAGGGWKCQCQIGKEYENFGIALPAAAETTTETPEEPTTADNGGQNVHFAVSQLPFVLPIIFGLMPII